MPDDRRGTGFLVREAGRWWATDDPAGVPEPVRLDDVLHGLPPVRDPDGGLGPPLAPDAVVAPVWCWIGRLTPAGAHLEDNDGRALVLDAHDLRLLDAVDPATTVADLAAATGVPSAAARLGRLVAANRLRVVGSADRAAEAGAADPRVTVAAADDADSEPPELLGHADHRIGVHPVWLERVGPALSLGMLTASARAWRDGALEEHFLIHRPQTASQFLADLDVGRGPAVLLCSNYVWSVDDNLALARLAKARRPELVVLHGGPSTPKYPGDAEEFLARHGDVADVLVRGEGEVTTCRILEALAPSGRLDPERLAAIPGLTFRDRDGAVVRTAEPERIADLDELPSPYLTGEFDHIDLDAWTYALSVETNRGCPYGCTFCDWGSATLSRLRKFDLDRVLAEMHWAAERGVAGIQICDANFGIMARDVEIARGLAEIHRRTGHPGGVGFTPPKNTNRHLTRIFDEVMDAGLLVSTAISLQTTDEATLAAVDRSNISTANYLSVAADLRRRGHPLTGDLLIGMPMQTYDSYRADLQFFVDHQIMARTWIIKMLPNAPMNEPTYRERYGIETDDQGVVRQTAHLSATDLARCLRLRRVEIIGNRMGVLRHVGMFLQWDLGVPFLELLDHVVEVTATTPERFPLVTWMFENFDLHATAPEGWHAFYGEVRRLLAEDLDVDPEGPDLAAVLAVQTALMPAPGRRFPHVVELDHDVVGWRHDATASLYTTGRATGPSRPLRRYPPATFAVTADPLRLCEDGLHFDGDTRDLRFESDFSIGQRTANELASPLVAVLPVFSGADSPIDARALVDEVLTPERLAAATGDDAVSTERRRIPVRSDLRVEAG